MTFGNFQVFIRQLTVEKLQLYLVSKGWQLINYGPPNTRGFEGGPGEGGDIPRIWVFESESHPKFRSRLQNALFSLSVVEKREPIEIARDISAVQVVALPTPSPTITTEQVTGRLRSPVHVTRLRNTRSTPLRINLPGASPELTLDLGEAVALESSDSARDWELHIAEDSLSIRGIPPTELACFELPGPEFVVGDTSKLAEFAHFHLRKTGAMSETMIEEVLNQMLATLARASFELPSSMVQGISPDGLLRQTAILSVAFAKRLPSGPSAHVFLWRLAVWLLAIANLQLPRRDLAARYFETALADDEAAPRLCLAWLQQHAVARN